MAGGKINGSKNIEKGLKKKRTYSGKGSSSAQLTRLFDLARFLAERGKSGATREEIYEEIYWDYEANSDAFLRKFNRDRRDLEEIYSAPSIEDKDEEKDETGIKVVKKEKRYYLVGAYTFMTPLKLKETEVLALATGAKLAGHFVQPLHLSANELWEKLKKRLPADSIRKGERLADAISLAMPVSDMERGDEIFQKVVRAIDEKKVLKVRQYENAAGEIIPCNISPCALYFKYHAWYMLGMSPEIDDKRPAVFRLNRMRMVEVLLDQSFIESPWSPEELRDNIEQDWHAANPREQYKIKLRITGPQALDVMETEFFKGEKKRLDSKGKNGAVLYEVTLKGLERITLWIMRSLECFEVIEPKELRDEIDRRVNEYLKHRKVMKG